MNTLTQAVLVAADVRDIAAEWFADAVLDESLDPEAEAWAEAAFLAAGAVDAIMRARQAGLTRADRRAV